MSEATSPADFTRKPLVCPIPGDETVTVRRDLPYGASDAGPLTMDLYRPVDAQFGARLPAVIFVSGYSDAGMAAFVGAKLKDWESYIGWARLTAAQGLAAVTYSPANPAADLPTLLEHLRQNAASVVPITM